MLLQRPARCTVGERGGDRSRREPLERVRQPATGRPATSGSLTCPSCSASLRAGRLDPTLAGLTMPARDLVARCSFPPAGTPVTLAVSGGADSLALLVLAVEAGCDATAVHVDHGLRRGSAAEADVVAEVGGPSSSGASRRSGSRSATGRTSRRGPAAPATPPSPPTCSPATPRTTRPRPCSSTCCAARASTVWPATTPRGDRCGCLRRRETHKLCADLGIQPVHDPSNDDPRFRRNRVRRELLPLLDSIAERDVAAVIARQADGLRADGELLEQLSLALDPTEAKVAGRRPRAARGSGGASLASHRRRAAPTGRRHRGPRPGRRPGRSRRVRGRRRSPGPPQPAAPGPVLSGYVAKRGVGGEAPAPVRQSRSGRGGGRRRRRSRPGWRSSEPRSRATTSTARRS